MHTDRQVREIVIPAAALAALQRAVREEAGLDVALVALRAAGRETGEVVLDELAFPDVGPSQISESDFWHRLSEFFSRRGWGGLRLDTSHPGVGLLDGTSWADTSEGSPYSEGLLSSILSGVVGAEIHVLRLPSSDAEGGSTRFAFGSEVTIRTLRARLSATGDARSALEAL